MEREFQWNWVSTKIVEWAFHPQSNGKAIPIPNNIFTSKNNPQQIIIWKNSVEGERDRVMRDREIERVKKEKSKFDLEFVSSIYDLEI